MMSTTKWIEGRVTRVKRWTPKLFSLAFRAQGFSPFSAGQFARVGLRIGDEIVGRPYSLVNPPSEEQLEIFAVEVEQGPLSPKLNALREGDTIYVMPRANGFFSITEIPAAPTLWCIATGTGLGPFLSMLRTPALWAQHDRVVLVHGARTGAELVYRDEISAVAQMHHGRFREISLVSREPNPRQGDTALQGRITARLDDGLLEQCVGETIDEKSHIMLCGNPQMVQDMIARLESRGLRKHRKREPGHYTIEAYW
jgi:ferredoxin/flavodoxin---NADP+ reductase